jgi:hypothetical protein
LGEFLVAKRALNGNARDFLAVPSHQAIGDDPGINALMADLVDQVQAEAAQAESATQQRRHLGLFDQALRFGALGGAEQFLNFGWSPAEAQGVWSADKRAGLLCHVPEGAVRMKWVLLAQCKGNSQVVVIRIGTQEVGRLKLGSTRARHELSLELPAFARVGGVVQVVFEFPHAQKEPHSVRLLGMYLSELVAALEFSDQDAALPVTSSASRGHA